MHLHCVMHMHYYVYRLVKKILQIDNLKVREDLMILNFADVSLRAESRLTDRSQTTIPASIRDALHLKPGEQIEYSLLPGGQVILSRKDETEGDPVVSQFLNFLENDMGRNPQHIHAVPMDLWSSIKELTAGIEVDLDTPLTDD